MRRTDEPTSVAVFGNSAGVLVAGTAGARSPLMTFPAALDRARGEGVAFSVTNHCRVAGIVSDAAGIWLDPLSTLRPDVVLLCYGMYEAFPRLVPRWLIVHLMGNRRHAGLVQRVYWRAADRMLRKACRLSGFADRFLPTRIGGFMTTRRFERELRLVVSRIVGQVGSRIVLVDGYAPASHPMVTPKMLRRVELNNDAISRVADEFKLEVFPLRALIAEMGARTALGDRLHLSDAAHRRVGAALAAFLTPAKWAATA